ncbi:MAG TPA: helix-turn-helix domain-containing protein [Streptosporangiaceae bacterium]|nr:helix-turn-helix domain-containing protein [Streptosporangiaceae bacterium]
MVSEQIAHVGRVADRGASTRATLLAAAREVFMQQGYAQAAITDIVALAGASVGSLYHHFAGKADLYLALYEDLDNAREARTRAAVRELREAGAADPMLLLLAGARGYLEECIEQREMAAIFTRGDGPPGFELTWRRGVLDWVTRNTEFFARSGETLDEAAAIVMTGALMLAVTEVSLAVDDDRARQLADGVLAVLARLGSRRP